VIIRQILENLKGKKIEVYVRDLGQFGCFQGILIETTEKMIIIKSRYNKITYIPMSEIVIVTEHDAKTEYLKEKFKDISMISSVSQL
jgi:hypothetical protein